MNKITRKKPRYDLINFIGKLNKSRRRYYYYDKYICFGEYFLKCSGRFKRRLRRGYYWKK